jgi:tetratricopeptide (TPR) repeat protein
MPQTPANLREYATLTVSGKKDKIIPQCHYNPTLSFPFAEVRMNARLITVIAALAVIFPSGASTQSAETYLNQGIMFAMRGDYGTAVEEFTGAIRLNPGMAGAYILRARALFASVSVVTGVRENFSGIDYNSAAGRISTEQVRVYDLVIEDLTQAIRLDPNHAETYNNRGNAYMEKSDFDRAIADFTEAIRLNPNYALAYSGRGIAYRNKRDYDRAIADYTQAIRLSPNFATAYYNRGFAYESKSDYDLAIADYIQAIRLNPNYALAYYGRGNMYLFKRDYSMAIADYTQTIRLDPNNIDAYLYRGFAYVNNGDADNAIADYTQVIKFAPNFIDTYLLRGVAYYLRGDIDRAITDWEAVLRLDPNNVSAIGNIEFARQQRGY